MNSPELPPCIRCIFRLSGIESNTFSGNGNWLIQNLGENKKNTIAKETRKINMFDAVFEWPGVALLPKDLAAKEIIKIVG